MEGLCGNLAFEEQNCREIALVYCVEKKEKLKFIFSKTTMWA
jgi:hypothetical protein